MVYAALESKLSLAYAFWHPGPRDLGGERGKEEGGWKSTRQYLLNPTSCWLLLTLSHQQHAFPPLRPIRPLGRQLSYANFPHLLPHVCSRWKQPECRISRQLLQQAFLPQLSEGGLPPCHLQSTFGPHHLTASPSDQGFPDPFVLKPSQRVRLSDLQARLPENRSEGSASCLKQRA